MTSQNRRLGHKELFILGLPINLQSEMSKLVDNYNRSEDVTLLRTPNNIPYAISMVATLDYAARRVAFLKYKPYYK